MSFTQQSNNEKTFQGRCSVCDTTMVNNRLEHFGDDTNYNAVFTLLIDLLHLIPKEKSRRPRIAVMIAFRRLLLHSNDLDHLEIANSPLGLWCMQSLQSSTRDLRIAAG